MSQAHPKPTAGQEEAPAVGPRGSTGHARGVRAMFRSRRAKRSAHTWQELAQCLFFIVEAIDDYLYTNEHRSDGSMRTIYSGPTRTKLLGGEPLPEKDLTMEWERMIHPDDRAAYKAHGERLTSGNPSEVLYRLQGYDGVTRWMHARARPRRGDGRVFVDGIVSDVTSKQRTRSVRQSGNCENSYA